MFEDESSENMTIGQLIRKVRQAASLSQCELAEKIGANQQRVSEWEKGIFKPKVDSRKKIAAACRIVDDKTLFLLLSL